MDDPSFTDWFTEEPVAFSTVTTEDGIYPLSEGFGTRQPGTTTWTFELEPTDLE